MPDEYSENAEFKSLDRYARQALYPALGIAGQKRLAASRAVVCGCGALGSLIANTLVRAGVGHVRIVDRDFVELSNLQRQFLFDEADIAAGLPKAIAAAQKLRRINSQIEIEPVVADVDFRNVETIVGDAQVIVDGTDNFETRFLLNDAAVKLSIPWVYGGAVGAEGRMLAIVPGETPCLTCLMQDAPPPGSMPTCDTAGVLAPAIGVIASLQSLEAMKLLAGHRDALNPNLVVVDLWQNQLRQVKVAGLREATDCRTCQRRDFAWLRGVPGSQTAVLCGRNAVQISVAAGERVVLEALEEKLRGVGKVLRNSFLLRLDVDDYQITVFPDGRAIIGGTSDMGIARGVYARYVGS
jgi:adenylyltransferase/sulfurtransferase